MWSKDGDGASGPGGSGDGLREGRSGEISTTPKAGKKPAKAKQPKLRPAPPPPKPIDALPFVKGWDWWAVKRTRKGATSDYLLGREWAASSWH